jgi:hypothetical protein
MGRTSARWLRLPGSRFLSLQARLLLCIFCLAGGLSHGMAADEGPANEAAPWSEDLLSRLLATPEAGAGNSEDVRKAEGMMLRSYQLRNLHVGEAGRAANLVSILRRMLPLDSRVTEDRAGNMLHVLSSTSAQEAVLELISAMDSDSADSTPVENASAVGERIPVAIKKALEEMAATRPDADQLRKVLAETTSGMEQRVALAVQEAQKQSSDRLSHSLLAAGGLLGAALVFSLLGLFVVQRRGRQREMAQSAKREATALAISPKQGIEAVLALGREQQDQAREMQKLMESFSIAYQADRQRGSLALEAVSKRHGELSATLEEMQHLRREIGENAGRMFLDVNRAAINEIVERASDALQSRALEVGLIAESASRKMDETASRLEVQNAKTEALAAELERTQREVDALFEKLRAAQDDALRAQAEAQQQREVASQRAIDLARKEATLAGLSLLIQEPMEDILANLGPAEEFPAPLAPVPPAGAVEKIALLAEDVPPAEVIPDTGPAEPAKPSENDSCSNNRYTFQITPVD